MLHGHFSAQGLRTCKPGAGGLCWVGVGLHPLSAVSVRFNVDFIKMPANAGSSTPAQPGTNPVTPGAWEGSSPHRETPPCNWQDQRIPRKTCYAFDFPWGFNIWKGFPCGSAGKEFACNAGNPGLISQARILEWVAIPFSRGSSHPWDQTHISCIGRQILYP